MLCCKNQRRLDVNGNTRSIYLDIKKRSTLNLNQNNCCIGLRFSFVFTSLDLFCMDFLFMKLQFKTKHLISSYQKHKKKQEKHEDFIRRFFFPFSSEHNGEISVQFVLD